ncbi:hypothetical protein AC249_AIPGENE24460 [Exaiptasia diaphana]|nr:hypothetical protein AC249_AIPGENE24460 [Exaiptasia diaphana]
MIRHAAYFSRDRICRSSVYVSKFKGTSRPLKCGSSELPCKTLANGFARLCWNGTVYIDGKGTRRNPYSCSGKSEKLTISKSFWAESYNEKTAFISCHGGITFQTLDNTYTNITMSGLTFISTTIVIDDTTAVFNNCVFIGSSPALDVKVSKLFSKTISIYTLNVSNSIFKENWGCIHMNSQNAKCNTVVLNIHNVTLRENAILKCGLVDILGSKTPRCKSLSVMTTWDNVIVQNNMKGSPTECKKSKTYPIHDSIFTANGRTIQLNFMRVISKNNSDLRFLGVNSRRSSINVCNSSYHGHHMTGKGGVMYITALQTKTSAINVTVIDSNFSNNVAPKGAAIHVQQKTGNSLSLKLSGVSFVNSFGYDKGCVISLKGDNSLQATIERSKLINCSYPCKGTNCSKKRHVGICLYSKMDICVEIKKSLFINNVDGSTVFIKNKIYPTETEKGILHISVINSTFQRNTADQLSQGAALSVNNSYHAMKKAVVNIINSSFNLNKGGMLLSNVETINIKNTTCKNNMHFCIKAVFDAVNRKRGVSLNTSIFIENSIFTRNEMPIYIFNKYPEVVNILLKDLLFYKNDFDEVIAITLESSTKSGLLTSGSIKLDGVCFISNSLKNSGGYLLGIHSSHKGNITVKIIRSVFKHNYQKPGISRSIFSLLYFYLPEDPKNSQACTLFPVYQYNNVIFFEDVTFENNTGSLSMVYLSSGKTLFRRCRFRNNFSRHPMIGAHIYVEDQGTASLRIENSSFLQYHRILERTTHEERLMQFVYAGANGPLELINSSFESNALTRIKSPLFTIQYGGYVWFDKNTNLFCPYGSSMIFENLSRVLQPNLTRDHCNCNITRFKFTCAMCSEGTYSLQRGSFHGSSLKQTRTTCLPCPFGANCTWKIKTTANFWGYLVSRRRSELNFTRCPHKYCEVPKQLSSYNGCYGNRTGTMCGACREGFTESMFNRNCRAIKECNDGWFWMVIGLYSAIMAIYFIFRPKISQIVIQKIFWFKKSPMVPPNSRIGGSHTRQKHGCGFSKILFYFYQVAELLMIRSHDDILHRSLFLAPVISFFNFEIEQIDNSSGCPFPGLNAVTKELFRSLQVFAAMATVCVIYLMYWLISLLTRRIRPYSAPYIAAIVEILLLGYERLGHTSLELLNCTPLTIDDRVQWRLFVDGNITCWVHWWQYALVAYNIIFVVPFLVVLWIGTSKLRRQEISSLQFVAACFAPLPFLMYWLVKRCFKKRNQSSVGFGYANYRDQATSEALLDVIEGPFRPPNGDSHGALYWDSILIGRRLVFLCLFSFVDSPLLRLFFMTIMCIVILMHNVQVMPYKEKMANILALVLLFIHVFIAINNLCQAVFVTDGVLPKKPTKKMIDALMMMNVVFLAGPPVGFAILVAIAVISQVMQVIFLLLTAIRACICPTKSRREEPLEFIDERESHREPLLVVGDEDYLVQNN